MPKNPRQHLQKPRKRRSPVEVIASNRVPVADAVDDAWRWWEASLLLDDLDADALHERRQALLDACANLDVTHLGALFQNAGSVITSAAGITSLQLFTNAPQRHLTHRTRNLLTALLWTVAHRDGLNPCPVIEDMPAIPPRISGQVRPIFDDEVLLLRLRAVHRLARPPKLAAPGVLYALTEAGAWPSEATHVCVPDFDDPAAPTTVTVRLDAARIDTNGRDLTLPGWVQPVLGAALARLKERDPLRQRCVFIGDHSNEHNSASVTSTQTITRAIEDVGLDAALMPQEIVYWRAARVACTQGRPAAIQLLGFTGDEAETRLREILKARTSVNASTPAKRVRSYRGL